MPSITGYPSGLRGKQLSLESSLLAVADIYGALSEKRPYREALPPSQITKIMDSEVPAKLDGECYEAPAPLSQIRLCRRPDKRNSLATAGSTPASK